MRCFYLRLQGIFFDVNTDGERGQLGFFTTFAIYAERETEVRPTLERRLTARLAGNGVAIRRRGLRRSICWIEQYSEYTEPPETMPEGFTFFPLRVAELFGTVSDMLRYRSGRHWRSIRLPDSPDTQAIA